MLCTKKHSIFELLLDGRFNGLGVNRLTMDLGLEISELCSSGFKFRSKLFDEGGLRNIFRCILSDAMVGHFKENLAGRTFVKKPKAGVGNTGQKMRKIANDKAQKSVTWRIVKDLNDKPLFKRGNEKRNLFVPERGDRIDTR